MRTSRGTADSSSTVDQVFELLARLEIGDLLRRHVHLLSRLGIAPLARAPLPDTEAPEAAQLDLLVLVQSLDDRVEHRLDDDLGVLLGQLRDPRELLQQLRLRHGALGTGAPGLAPLVA